MHADRPLDHAVETATIQLMEWMITEYGLSPTDAYCLVSTCPDFRINVYQMCRIRNLARSPAPRSPSPTCREARDDHGRRDDPRRPPASRRPPGPSGRGSAAT